jgi:hypothetical protein
MSVRKLILSENKCVYSIKKIKVVKFFGAHSIFFFIFFEFRTGDFSVKYYTIVFTRNSITDHTNFLNQFFVFELWFYPYVKA